MSIWRAGGTSSSGHPDWANPACEKQKKLAYSEGPIPQPIGERVVLWGKEKDGILFKTITTNIQSNSPNLLDEIKKAAEHASLWGVEVMGHRFETYYG